MITLVLFDLERPKSLQQGNTWGRAYFYGSATPPSQRGGAPVLPNFGVPSFLCLCPLTQNDQIRLVTRMGGKNSFTKFLYPNPDPMTSKTERCLPCPNITMVKFARRSDQ